MADRRHYSPCLMTAILSLLIPTPVSLSTDRSDPLLNAGLRQGQGPSTPLPHHLHCRSTPLTNSPALDAQDCFHSLRVADPFCLQHVGQWAPVKYFVILSALYPYHNLAPPPSSSRDSQTPTRIYCMCKSSGASSLTWPTPSSRCPCYLPSGFTSDSPVPPL